MTNFLSNIIDIAKGKERADWVVRTWLSDHADEYGQFVAGIEKMVEGDMSAAFEMYKVMASCMPPEASGYYDILLRLFTGEPNALHDMVKLEHADAIGECAINGKTLYINIGTGEITTTDNPQKGCLVVKASDIMTSWDKLPLQSKAYCKEQYEKIKTTVPSSMQEGLLDTVINLIKIHYVANLVFMPGMMANLYDKAINENNSMLFAMYYFVTFDHGLQRMAKTFSTVVSNETPGIEGVTIFKSTIHNIALTSLNNGWDSKETWTTVADDSNNDEAWKEIMHAVRHAKPRHGKPTKQQTIDVLLKCTNKKKAKALVKQFLDENDGLFGPAYLLWSLDAANCIEDVTYMAFHRTLELFLNKKIVSKKPQERYGLLKNQQKIPNRHKRIWNEIARIEAKWVPLFAETR